MKYFVDRYDEERGEWVREEITKEKAISVLANYYNKPEDLVELPCYYRTMFGGVEVVAE